MVPFAVCRLTWYGLQLSDSSPLWLFPGLEICARMWKALTRASSYMVVNPEHSHVHGRTCYVQFDCCMACSCFAFAGPAVMYYVCGAPVMSILFWCVVGTSTSSDAVVHHCTPLDLVDRFLAAACYGAAAVYGFRWITEPFTAFTVFKFCCQAVLFAVPLIFLVRSRRVQIGSEAWRKNHFAWHIISS